MVRVEVERCKELVVNFREGDVVATTRRTGTEPVLVDRNVHGEIVAIRIKREFDGYFEPSSVVIHQ